MYNFVQSAKCLFSKYYYITSLINIIVKQFYFDSIELEGVLFGVWNIFDPVYTVPNPHGHDIKLNSFKTSVALKSMIILHNLITTNHKKSGRSKDGLKLTELDVVTMRIRYRVNGVFKFSRHGPALE